MSDAERFQQQAVAEQRLGGERTTKQAPGWVQRLTTLDPSAPDDDLAALDRHAAQASIVGIGMTVRGARSSRQLYRLAHRITRRLVEHGGYRLVTLEEEPDQAAALDDYIAGRRDDLRQVLAAGWAPWAVEEFAELLQTLRSLAEASPQDRVRIVGVDSSPPSSPAEADEVFTTGLVQLADTGARVVHWGGVAHTAACPITVHHPAGSEPRQPAGAGLRRRLHDRYCSIGLTVGSAGPPAPIPTPDPDLAESDLAAIPADTFLLDLSDPELPADVLRNRRPARVRTVGPSYDPGRDAAHHLECPSLADAFDLVVHQQRSTPATPITASS